MKNWFKKIIKLKKTNSRFLFFLILFYLFLTITLIIVWIFYLRKYSTNLEIVISSLLIFMLFCVFANIYGAFKLRQINSNAKNKYEEIKNFESKILMSHQYNQKLQMDALINSLIKSLPLPILIINKDLQTLSQNDIFVKTFNPVNNKKPLINIFLHNDFMKFVQSIAILHSKNKKTLIFINQKYYQILALTITWNNEEVYMFIFEDTTKNENIHKKEKEFISNITHELKTPISATLLALEIIEENNGKPISEELEIIKRQNKRMNQIIDDLLNLISPLNESVLLNRKLNSVHEMLNHAIDNVKHLSKKKKILILINNKDIFLECDEIKIVQVFTNLIKNAIFYSQENAKIDCNIFTHVSNLVEIQIKDYGVGIESKNLQKIFDRFFCVNKDRSRANGGSGLGLAISKELVELHNGYISVESIPNKETIFSIFLHKE